MKTFSYHIKILQTSSRNVERLSLGKKSKKKKRAAIIRLGPDLTDLTPDLLFDALLRLGQSGHGGHVGPTERTHHRLQDHVSEELLHVCEEHIEDSVPNLDTRRTKLLEFNGNRVNSST